MRVKLGLDVGNGSRDLRDGDGEPAAVNTGAHWLHPHSWGRGLGVPFCALLVYDLLLFIYVSSGDVLAFDDYSADTLTLPCEQNISASTL